MGRERKLIETPALITHWPIGILVFLPLLLLLYADPENHINLDLSPSKTTLLTELLTVNDLSKR